MSEFTQSMIRAYGNWLPFRGDPTNLRIIQGFIANKKGGAADLLPLAPILDVR